MLFLVINCFHYPAAQLDGFSAWGIIDHQPALVPISTSCCLVSLQYLVSGQEQANMIAEGYLNQVSRNHGKVTTETTQRPQISPMQPLETIRQGKIPAPDRSTRMQHEEAKWWRQSSHRSTPVRIYCRRASSKDMHLNPFLPCISPSQLFASTAKALMEPNNQSSQVPPPKGRHDSCHDASLVVKGRFERFRSIFPGRIPSKAYQVRCSVPHDLRLHDISENPLREMCS